MARSDTARLISSSARVGFGIPSELFPRTPLMLDVPRAASRMGSERLKWIRQISSVVERVALSAGPSTSPQAAWTEKSTCSMLTNAASAPGMPLAVKVVRVEDKAFLMNGRSVGSLLQSGLIQKAKRDQLINEIHTLFRITKSHFLIELYDA